MPDITIREARADDCGRMMELVKELALFERAPDEVTVDPEHFRESGFGETPVWWAYVAEADGFVVAFALYYIRYSTWKGQRMYLEDILVTEEWRCKGIGTMLMDKLVEVAREKKFSGMLWQVLDWNEPAIKFYKRYEPKFDGEWLNVSLELNRPA
jgi:ribosomal protein S18 acetylase RimI-like enzyme